MIPDRWIIASRIVPVLDAESQAAIAGMGGVIGGGNAEIRLHIHVSSDNRDAIESFLRSKGLTVSEASNTMIRRSDSDRGSSSSRYTMR